MRALSILVVDDDQPTRRVLQLWLELHGHRVFDAGGGKAALEVLKAHPVDLVITDVLMPDGNGLDLIQALNRRERRTPVLAISGGGPHMAGSMCLQRAQLAGADALLLKPFKKEQLLHAMQYVLGLGADTGTGQPRPKARSTSAPAEVRLFSGMGEETSTKAIRSREMR